ncbi:hypothetical protein [Mesobacillus zeae]|uniref:hypothetical protein n=1 Tax=Mesobacillus zeae TaxID=1917180 RepID=UPI0015E676C8|nr:hypothetical protein [Mesobacillus zeae]
MRTHAAEALLDREEGAAPLKIKTVAQSKARVAATLENQAEGRAGPALGEEA